MEIRNFPLVVSHKTAHWRNNESVLQNQISDFQTSECLFQVVHELLLSKSFYCKTRNYLIFSLRYFQTPSLLFHFNFPHSFIVFPLFSEACKFSLMPIRLPGVKDYGLTSIKIQVLNEYVVVNNIFFPLLSSIQNVKLSGFLL